MFELHLKFETTKLSGTEPSVLIEKIFSYLKNYYKILEKTDNKLVFTFNDGGGLIWMQKSNRFKVIQNGIFEVNSTKITLTYYIDVLFYTLFISVGLILGVVVNNSAVLICIYPSLELISKIITSKKSSRIMLQSITSNSPHPVITKFQSIGVDRKKI